MKIQLNKLNINKINKETENLIISMVQAYSPQFLHMHVRQPPRKVNDFTCFHLKHSYYQNIFWILYYKFYFIFKKYIVNNIFFFSIIMSIRTNLRAPRLILRGSEVYSRILTFVTLRQLELMTIGNKFKAWLLNHPASLHFQQYQTKQVYRVFYKT